jgi:hypothetical protein
MVCPTKKEVMQENKQKPVVGVAEGKTHITHATRLNAL